MNLGFFACIWQAFLPYPDKLITCEYLPAAPDLLWWKNSEYMCSAFQNVSITNEVMKTQGSDLEPRTESLLWALFDIVFISFTYHRAQVPGLPVEWTEYCCVGGGKSHRGKGAIRKREALSNWEAQPGKFSRGGRACQRERRKRGRWSRRAPLPRRSTLPLLGTKQWVASPVQGQS